MTYRVEWSRAAAKQLLRIPKKQRMMILCWVKENLDGCENPKAVAGGKRLQGTAGGWRWRIGSYRVLAHIDERKLVINVVRVGHRQGVYENIPKI